MQSFDWNDLKPFLALCRTGTLAAAARQIGASETTVSRRIKALERGLDAPVVQRDATGRYGPTPLGEQLLQHAHRVEAEALAIQNAAGQARDRVAGTVRISAVAQICNRVLVPHLPQLIADHPGITVELTPEPRNIDLSKREADLALRLARPAKGGMQTQARRIGILAHAVYRPMGPDTPLPWIGYTDDLSALPQARWLANAPGEPAALRVTDIETACAAVAHGLGRTLLPVIVGDNDPRLQRVIKPPHAALPTREVWLLSHRDQQGFGAIEAVKDWLTALPWA